MACRRPVATAIVRRAEMRAALQDFPGNADAWLTWIKARRLGAAARILRNTAGFRRIGFVPGRPPVGGPLPDIADHVADAVTVRWKRGDRRGALITVLAQI